MREIKTEWDLKGYYFDSMEDERIEQLIKEDTEGHLPIFINLYKDRISELTDEQFLDFLEAQDNLFQKLTKVYYYFSYLNTLDTQDQSVIKKLGEISNIWSDCSQQLLFISEEYKTIGYDRFIEMSEKDIFKDYKNSLINIANDLEYMLSEEQEKNLIEVNKVISIFCDTYTELTNSFEFEINGEKKTKAEIYYLRSSDDENMRKLVTEALLQKYGENKIVLGNIYKAVCKDNVSNVKIREYDGVMHGRNLSEEMDDDVVNTLLDTVKSYYPLHHKHMKNKAKILGKEKLQLHDVFAPIPSNGKKEFSFEEGYELYMNSIKEFDSEFYDYSLKIFQDGRVSVFPRQGKMGGAYASYNKDKESFVMLNHTSDFDSIMTLAHELGHAIHGWYAQVQKRSNYDAPLSLAETASIFSETFVFENVLETISPEEREYFIMKNLDDIFGTMFRQVMYVDFERECHSRTLNGEELSYDDFNEIWLRKSQEFYGDSVELPEMTKYGWSVIPHLFQTPFYCYAYSFGNILSFNLYKMYKESENKDEFIEMYKNILRSGGSKRPKDLLLENGIDITSTEFYDRAFSVIESFLNQTEIKN